MALFAIADLHLSIGTDKPMDIFKGWDNYVERLTDNWKKIVKDTDTVVIAGDISWAMKLSETTDDFDYINKLPGRKIFLKGNHDYWWETCNKMNKFLECKEFDSINILFNNSFECDEYVVCGTRGWLIESEADEDRKILNREVGRLKASLDSAVKCGKEPVVFLHYPPVYGNSVSEEIIDVLHQYNVKKCYYGHIHGASMIRGSYNGDYQGIELKLISCDALSFIPLLVR